MSEQGDKHPDEPNANSSRVSQGTGDIHPGAPAADAAGSARATEPKAGSSPVPSPVTQGTPDMRALVQDIAKALVDEPDQVAVSAVEKSDGTVLQLSVAANDLGKVIGKQGRTARSLRTLLAAASMKLHQRYTLEIVE